MFIRESNDSDVTDIMTINTRAFGNEKGPEIADLVHDLLDDQTALPLLSLVALENERLVGHILFTNAKVEQTDETVSAQILAPLAVVPEKNSLGVGRLLVNEGLKMLQESGVELVFVLGHPDYYPRHGFKLAGVLGYEAPYPIPEKDAGAWMVQELIPGVIGRVTGKIQCADVLNQPEHWRE